MPVFCLIFRCVPKEGEIGVIEVSRRYYSFAVGMNHSQPGVSVAVRGMWLGICGWKYATGKRVWEKRVSPPDHSCSIALTYATTRMVSHRPTRLFALSLSGRYAPLDPDT